jgi:TusA-related sulfurtransferase
MEGEHYCRIHAPNRTLSIYDIAAGNVADTTMEELIEKGNLRDLTSEFALTKLALAELHNNNVPAEARLDALLKFFTVAEKLQKIETGGLLNINWSDPLVVAVRDKFSKLIGCFVELLNKFVEDDETRKIILENLKKETQMIGNSLTIRPAEEDAQSVMRQHDQKQIKQ